MQVQRIAEISGVSRHTVRNTARRLGLDRAPLRETARSWTEIRREVLARDNYTCRYCGEVGGLLRVGFVVPPDQGGPVILDNMVTRCQECAEMVGKKRQNGEKVGKDAVRVNFHLDGMSHARVQAYCKLKGISMSSLMRRLLLDHLTEEERNDGRRS